MTPHDFVHKWRTLTASPGLSEIGYYQPPSTDLCGLVGHPAPTDTDIDKQLLQYRESLQNPPLLIVGDFRRDGLSRVKKLLEPPGRSDRWVHRYTIRPLLRRAQASCGTTAFKFAAPIPFCWPN
jgi:hypothetical protein